MLIIILTLYLLYELHIWPSTLPLLNDETKYFAELFSEVKGPVPHIGSTIFQGKCFFLTYVDTIAAPQDSEIRSGANLESDESSLEGLKGMLHDYSA